jgi:hypothetical protein
MRIDPDIEKPTRDLLSHAIRGELEEMATLVETIGEERYSSASRCASSSPDTSAST